MTAEMEAAAREARLHGLAPRLAQSLRRLVTWALEGAGPNPMGWGPSMLEAREVLTELDAPLYTPGGGGTDPTWCSCKRYLNGGRKETDQQCPLHMGEGRD